MTASIVPGSDDMGTPSKGHGKRSTVFVDAETMRVYFSTV